MAKFVLQPCRVQANFIVPALERPTFEVDWKGLVELVAPTKTPQSFRTLRQMRTGGFIGISRPHPTSTTPLNFVLINKDRSGSLTLVLKKDPDFIRQILRVYRVEKLQWDDKMTDLGVSHGRPVPPPAA